MSKRDVFLVLSSEPDGRGGESVVVRSAFMDETEAEEHIKDLKCLRYFLENPVELYIEEVELHE